MATHAATELSDLFDDQDALAFLTDSLDANSSSSSASALSAAAESAHAVALSLDCAHNFSSQQQVCAPHAELSADGRLSDLDALVDEFNCSFGPTGDVAGAVHELGSAPLVDTHGGDSASSERAISGVAEAKQIHTRKASTRGAFVASVADDEVEEDEEWTLERKKLVGRHSRRREELIYLRRKVDELEAKVDLLKRRSSSADTEDCTASSSIPTTQAADFPSSSTSAAFSAFTTKRDDSLWEKVAARQLQERQKAELHNRKLRSALETQLQLAKSLEKILKRRRTFEALLESSEARKRVKLVPGELGDDEAILFDELLGSMDDLYAAVDKVTFEALQGGAASHTFREILVKPEAAFGLVMEIVESMLLPAEPAVAYRAMWRFAGEKGVNDSNYFEVKTSVDNNVSKRTFGVKFTKGSDSASFRGTQASKKYLEEQRMVIVSKSVMSSIEAAASPAHGLVFEESKWTVLSLFETAASATSELPVTLCQTRTLLVPRCWGPSLKTGVLTDFVTSSWERTNESSDQLVENMLLEEMATLRI